MLWLVIIGGLYLMLGGIAAVYLFYCLVSIAVKLWEKDKF